MEMKYSGRRAGVSASVRLVLGALLVAVIATAHAAGPPRVPRILVTGEGETEVPPDMATLSLTVTREAETAREALDANSAAMGEVLSAMRDAGVDESDLQTTGFAIEPKRVYPPAKPSGERRVPRIVGYTVRNGLVVRVRELERLGAILDRAVTLGVNEGGDISFGNAEPDEAVTRARERAVKDALSRANTLAAAAGVKVGRILEISEQSSRPRPVPMARAEMAMAADSGAVPIAAGRNTYRVQVNISLAIDQ